MGATAEYFYYPFPIDWWHPRRWRREFLRSPRGVPIALNGYRQVLTDEVIFGRNWAGHDLAKEYIFRGNRWRMLETGWVLSKLNALTEYEERLLSADSYAQACAELRAALLLARMGLHVRRDPANMSTLPQKRKRGPDWLALHRGGRFGVEVKCPRMSDRTQGYSTFVTHASFTAVSLLGAERSANLLVDPATVAAGTNGNWAHLSRAENLVLDALAEAEATGSATTALGTVVPISSEFSPMVGPIPTDEAHEAARIRTLLQDAADQLVGWEPGIAIIDTSMDPALMGRCCAVADVMSETWASQLAAVFLVADTYPGFAITIVEGPKYEAWASAHILGPRACARGHLHVETFGGPPKVCQLDGDFYDYPAFCVPQQGHYRSLS